MTDQPDRYWPSSRSFVALLGACGTAILTRLGFPPNAAPQDRLVMATKSSKPPTPRPEQALLGRATYDLDQARAVPPGGRERGSDKATYDEIAAAALRPDRQSPCCENVDNGSGASIARARYVDLPPGSSPAGDAA